MNSHSPNNVSSGRQHAELHRELAEHPYRFNFFQAVRLLMRSTWQSTSDGNHQVRPVGHDYAPHSEVVRFRALPSHSFPPAEIASFLPSDQPPGQAPAEMTVSFLGLFGPVSALPQHYTQTVIDRLRMKDHALRNFLDLFNHRTISLYYRAWEKHRVPPLMERAYAEGQEDAFTRALFCLVGLGRPALRNRMKITDQTLLYYSGLFAHYPRNAVSVERMLADYLRLPVTVKQFQGQWLRLEPAEQTAMPGMACPDGQNCQLGTTAIAGERVWSIEHAFRVRLGPMSYPEFRDLFPGSQRLTQLAQLVRTYVGPEFDFDTQLILRREEVPRCQLSANEADGPRLGWNTWACSHVPKTDADQAVFISEGCPTS